MDGPASNIEIMDCDTLIFGRTRRGHRAALEDDIVDVCEKRLLLLVNGFTPLDKLVSRLDKADWQACVRSSLDQGLIRNVRTT